MLVVVKLLLGARAPHLGLVVACRGVVGREVVGGLRGDLLVNAAPDGVNDVLVVEALEDAIAADHEEVVVVFEFETFDLGVAHDNVLISPVLLLLRLDVAKSSRDREPPREDPQRPLHVEVLLFGRSCRLREGLRAVDFSSGSLDADALLVVVGLVVATAHGNLGPRVDRHDATAISYVDYVGHVVDDHYDRRA